MITASQIRAARALLGWSQAQLVRAARLTPAALSRLETGLAKGRSQTLERLEETLTHAGIEFLEGEGVRFRRKSVGIIQYEGANAIQQMQDDIFAVMLSSPEKEMLLNGVDERKFFTSNAHYLREHGERMLSSGIKQKILIQESDRFFIMPPEMATYRWIARELFGRVPHLVYGHKVAIIFWGPPVQVIVMESTALAETYRRQFYALWRLARPVPFTAKEVREIRADNFKNLPANRAKR